MSNWLKFTIILALLIRVALVGTISKDGFLMAYDFLETVQKQDFPKQVYIENTVRIRDYFRFMDSLVATYEDLTEYPLSEYLLVRANPWIIDTLVDTDYYRMAARDSFVYDQKQLIVLPKGSVLGIPDSLSGCNLLRKFENTYIDINIPEFTLRIYQDSSLLYTFPIRVGQNRKRYLAMGDRLTDLRTKQGKGIIIKHVKDPDFYNPVDGKQFYFTKRDDQKTTLMPQIPWLETEIDGIRNGQMIHPTTNPETLGKSYSNGCIGVREADAWIIYYYAPIGTPITIRYHLKVRDENGNEKVLRDIYGLL
ncbi:L,D-transpeptidase [Ulvibacterium sp.]|uniref:L,D-transpeptidase n=1 Tax=Ulvibacterium sp. TaxID=2665914 RepID=UPI003BACC87E